MITIKDVAKLAGVSIATVSRILNNRGAISENTRKKVHKAMQELHYQPNEIARALQKKESHVIGLIVPTISYDFFSRLIEAIEAACNERGYKLMLCRSGGDGEKELEMVSMLQGNKVAGVLLCSRVGDTSIYTKYNLPIVSIDRKIVHIPSVTSDNEEGGTLAAEALWNAGCRNPLFVSANIPEYMPVHLREQGFLKFFQQKKMTCYSFYFEDSMLLWSNLSQEFFEYLKENPQIDGIFANGDVLAAKILSGFIKANMKIHTKLPLVGFDGLEIAEMFDITTVAQPIEEMGECAVDLLVRKISGKLVPERSTLPVKLVERGSCKK